MFSVFFMGEAGRCVPMVVPEVPMLVPPMAGADRFGSRFSFLFGLISEGGVAARKLSAAESTHVKKTGRAVSRHHIAAQKTTEDLPVLYTALPCHM